MNISIIRNKDPLFDRVSKLTYPNIEYYAMKHNYELVDMNTKLPSTDSWYWYNIWSIINVLKNKTVSSDWLVWLDSDILIMDPTKKLEEFIDNDNYLFVGAIRTLPCNFSIEYTKKSIRCYIDYILRVISVIHTGVFFVKNDSRALDVLMRIYLDRRFRYIEDHLNMIGWDEGILGILLMYEVLFRKLWKFIPLDSILTVDSSYSKVEKFVDYVGMQPLKQYSKGDFILHALNDGSRNSDPKSNLIEESKIQILEKYL